MAMDKEKRKRRLSLPNWLPARKNSLPATLASNGANSTSVSPIRNRRRSHVHKPRGKSTAEPVSPTASLCRIEITLPGGKPEEYVIHEDSTIGDVRNLLGLPLSDGSDTEPYKLREGNTRAVLADHVEVSIIGSKHIIVEETSPQIKKKGDRTALRRQTIDLIESFCKAERAFYKLLQDDIEIQCAELRECGFSRKDCKSLFGGLESYLHNISELIDNVSINGAKSRRSLGDSLKQFWSAGQEYYFTFQSSKRLVSRTVERFVNYSAAKREQMQEKLRSKPIIEALLIMPIQRVPQYDRFLTDLITAPKSDLNQDDLDYIQSNFKQVAVNRNIDFSRAQNEFKVLQVQDRFPHDDLRLDDNVESPTLRMRDPSARRMSAPITAIRSIKGTKSSPTITPSSNFRQKSPSASECFQFNPSEPTTSRVYIQEGPVRLSMGVTTNDRVFILFSDLLIVAKAKSSSTFKLKYRVRLCEIWLSTCIDEVIDSSVSLDKSFVIGWPTTNFVATFSSQEDRSMWWNILNKQVNQQRILEQPKVTNLKICCRHSDDSSVCSKSLAVCIDDNARDVVKLALDHFDVKDDDGGDYQLWAISDKENTAYPLIGHELPFAIKMSHVRDALLTTVSPQGLLSPTTEGDSPPPLSPDAVCQFILKKSRKSNNRLHLDLPTSQKKWRKPMKKSPIIHWGMNKKSSGKLSDVAVPTGRLFGHKLTLITNDQELIPKPIHDTLKQLFRRGPGTTGIFRKSALQRRVKELRESFDTGVSVELESVSVVVLAAVLKDFLRSLPNSVFGSDNYNDLQQNKSIEEVADRIADMTTILDKLPSCNAELLKAFVTVLYHIARFSDVNNMTSYNLAVCVAPSVMWSPPTTKASAIDQSGMAAEVVQFLIDNYVELFGEDAMWMLGPESDICLESTQNGDDSDAAVALTDVGQPPLSVDDNENETAVPLSPNSDLARSDSSFGTNDSECSQDGKGDLSLPSTRHFPPTSPTPGIRGDSKSNPVSPLMERKSSSPIFSRVEPSHHPSTDSRRHSHNDLRDCNDNYATNGVYKGQRNRRVLTSMTTSAELIEHKRPNLTPMMIKKTSVGGTTSTQLVRVFAPASSSESTRSQKTSSGFVPYFQRQGPAPSYEEAINGRRQLRPETNSPNAFRRSSGSRSPVFRVQTETHGMELIQGSPPPPIPEAVDKREALDLKLSGNSEISVSIEESSDDELSSDAASRRSSEDVQNDAHSDISSRKIRRGRHKLPVRRTGSEPNQSFGTHRTYKLSLERMERLRKARIQEQQYGSESLSHSFDSNTMRKLVDFTNIFNDASLRKQSPSLSPTTSQGSLPNGLIREPFHLQHPRKRTGGRDRSTGSDSYSDGSRRSSSELITNNLVGVERLNDVIESCASNDQSDDDDDNNSELNAVFANDCFTEPVRRLSSTGSDSVLSDDRDSSASGPTNGSVGSRRVTNSSGEEIATMCLVHDMKAPSPEDLKRIMLQDESYV